MQYRRSRLKSVGFTLIEMLVVLAILGMLATLVGPSVLKQFDKSKTRAALVQIKNIEQAAGMFKLDVGRYPTMQEQLQALVDKPASAPGWSGPYMDKLPADPWGNPYRYENPGKMKDVDIFSYGADNAAGGEGDKADIGNWM